MNIVRMHQEELMDKEKLKTVIDPDRNRRRKTPVNHQMNLGSLIKLLRREHPRNKVITSEGNSIGIPFTYGQPGDLVFAVSGLPITVSELIKVCEEIMTRNFRRRDGSFFRITHAALLWNSPIGNSERKMIVDVISAEDTVKLLLKNTPQD